MTSSEEIFCCYSRKDQQLLIELKAHLMSLQRQGIIIIYGQTPILMPEWIGNEKSPSI